MKISAQDEYGIRIMLRIARADTDEGLSSVQLAELEGLSQPYVSKITRQLRLGGFIESTKGRKGGYVLARPADEIVIGEVVRTLGGKLFDDEFCNSHSGQAKICTNSLDCSVRSLWNMVQACVDKLLESVTLDDLIGKEQKTSEHLKALAERLELQG